MTVGDSEARAGNLWPHRRGGHGRHPERRSRSASAIIDTAQSYGTEAGVGEAARRSGIPRSELFITTKVADTRLDKSQFMDSVERSLETIGLGPVDLLLIHWPSQNDAVPFDDYILALAEAQHRGHHATDRRLELPDRSAGAHRAAARSRRHRHGSGRDPPYTCSRRSWRSMHEAKSLTLTAYQPLVRGAIATDPVLRRIGEKHGVAASAVSLAFLMAEGQSSSRLPQRGESARQSEGARCRAGQRRHAGDPRPRSGHRRINPDKSPAWDD